MLPMNINVRFYSLILIVCAAVCAVFLSSSCKPSPKPEDLWTLTLKVNTDEAVESAIMDKELLAKEEEYESVKEMTEAEKNYIKALAVDRTMEILKKRAKAFGVFHHITKHETDPDKIVLELRKKGEEERVKKVLTYVGFLSFRLVEAGPVPLEEALLEEYAGELPEGTEVLEYELQYYLLYRAPIVTGADLDKVRPSQDYQGNPALSFSMNEHGAMRMKRFTSQNIGKQMAVVLNGEVHMIATIQERIGRDGQLTGQFTMEEVHDLALVLRAGAFPASVVVE